MSSQLGGTVNIPASYNPNRQSVSTYRAKSIESNAFSSWAGDHMYKSSYAHFHSKVFRFYNPRNQPIQRPAPSQATKDSFPKTDQKVSMERE